MPLFRQLARWLCGAVLCAVPWLPSPTHAQSYAIDVQPAQEATLSIVPRQITSLAFRVTNRGRDGEFDAEVGVPQGWRLVSREAPFALKEGESKVRFVSIYVPEAARAGTYTVSYAVRDRARPDVRNAAKIVVDVQATLKLQVTAVDAADYVIAGETYRTVFLVQNRGNANLDVAFKTVSARGYKVEGSTGALSLEPGASRRIEAVVATEVSTRPDQDWLTLTAKPADGGAAQSATASIKVIPRVSGIAQAYDTIPASATLSWMSGKPNGTRRSGWQAEFAGAGALDATGERKIDFLLRGPNANDIATYGLQQQYYVKYADRAVDAVLGDQTYVLSPLTELGFYGAGAGGAYRTGKASFGAYAAQSIAGSASPRQEAAASAGYDTDDAGRWDANLLHLNQKWNGQVNGLPQDFRVGANVFGLRNRMQWLPGLTSDVEVAGSASERNKVGQAFRANVVDTRAPFTWAMTVIDASPYYAGYYSDQRLAAGNFRYDVGTDWNVHGYLNLQRNNLDANPLAEAPDQRWYGLGTDYRLGAGSEASASIVYRSAVDRRPVPDFDMRHRGLRLGISQQFAEGSVSAIGEWGTSDDYAHGTRYPTSFYVANANWRPTSAQSYGVFATYDDSTFSNTRQPATSTVGASATIRPLPTTTASLLASRSSGPGAASIVDVRLSHTLPNKHVIALFARYTTGIDSATEAMVSYSIPFDLPVGRRKDIAALRGRVFDAETGNGVADVVLRLDGIVAVSDASGSFVFPALKPGSYHLSIDRADTASGRVPARPMPLDVEMMAGDDANVEIPMIRGVTLAGIVRSFDTAPPSQASDAGRPVAGVLVVMRNGERVYKRATDREGRFRLGGLPPGTWTVGVDDDDGLPAGTVPERRQITVETVPGAQAEVEVKLVPRVRSIRMQAPLGTAK
jgi:hypothetical protein